MWKTRTSLKNVEGTQERKPQSTDLFTGNMKHFACSVVDTQYKI